MCGGRAPGMILRVLGALLVVSAGPTLAQAGDEHLQVCLDSFVVHKDKIIRTQDSQEMGAKYLTVVDVETRIECMKWCCETDHCDVFIFEEKKPGSCYLFHCGPPHDFKCKFTTHANYSSAVLTNDNRQNAAALEEQIRRTEQEHELKSLRKIESPSKEYNYFTGLPALTSTTPVPVALPVSTKLAPVKIPMCSRNQFKCRTSGDCIAIYNVCNGIPQCNDGSDEAADLGCPDDKTTIPPPLPPLIAVSSKPYVILPPEVLRYQQMLQQQQQQQQPQQQQQQQGQVYPIVYTGGHVPDASKGWAANPNLRQMAIAQEINYSGRGYNPQEQVQVQQSPDESIGGSGSIGMGQQLPLNYKPLGYQWNNYQGPNYEQNVNKINNEAAFDVIHAQNILPPNYEHEQPSRIFNHKIPGLHFNDKEATNDGYRQEPNRGYVPYYSAANHHENSWQDGNSAQMAHVPVPTSRQEHPQQEHPDDDSKNQLTSSTFVPPCDPPSKQEDVSKTRNGNEKKPLNNEIHDKIHALATKESSNSEQLQTHEKKQSNENDVTPSDHKAHELELRAMADTHLQEHENLAIAEHIRAHHSTRLEDLEMSRPKGAVISLALGLTVTVVMAILIACRLRVVKRRGRGRGHDSYAHDADYLVNGMYL